MQDFRARDEDLAHFRIRDQIEIALAIARLDIFQAVPFFRHREQRLGEEIQVFDMNAQFIGPGAEQVAFDADEVAQVEELIERIFLFADGVLAHVDLESLAILHQMREASFAHAANGHNAPGDADLYARVLVVRRFCRRIRPGSAESYA